MSLCELCDDTGMVKIDQYTLSLCKCQESKPLECTPHWYGPVGHSINSPLVRDTDRGDFQTERQT